MTSFPYKWSHMKWISLNIVKHEWTNFSEPTKLFSFLTEEHYSSWYFLNADPCRHVDIYIYINRFTIYIHICICIYWCVPTCATITKFLIYIYISIHVDIYTSALALSSTHVYICKNISMCRCTHTFMCVHAYICIYTNTDMCILVKINVRIYLCIPITYTHIYYIHVCAICICIHTTWEIETATHIITLAMQFFQHWFWNPNPELQNYKTNTKFQDKHTNKFMNFFFVTSNINIC